MFYRYWWGLVKKNESLNNPDNVMHISVASFKSQLKKAYESGARSGKPTKSAAKAFDKVGGKKDLSDVFDDFNLGGLFGGQRK